MKCFFAGLTALLLFSGCAAEMGRGSARTLYTIADPLEVHCNDIGKNIQLRLDQKLLFTLEKDEENPGRWELVDYDKRTMLLLSETPRVAVGFQGFLLQARVMGSGEVTLRFIPAGEDKPPRDVKFEISIRR